MDDNFKRSSMIELFNTNALDSLNLDIEYVSFKCRTPGCGNKWGFNPHGSKVSLTGLVCKECKRRLEEFGS